MYNKSGGIQVDALLWCLETVWGQEKDGNLGGNFYFFFQVKESNV